MAKVEDFAPTSIRPVEQTRPVYLLAQESIKDYIIRNQLAPGSSLPPEGTLAKLLGISRNSVRESVKSLETLGVVVARQGSGLFVGDFTFDVLLDNLPYGLHSDMSELADLLEVRRVLETGMVGRVLELVDEAQLNTLRSILDTMRERAEADQTFPAEDRAFHHALFARVGNRVLIKLIDVFWLAHNRTAASTDIRDLNPRSTHQWHEAIYAALVSGKAADLVATLDHHYDGIFELLNQPHTDTPLD